MVSSTLLALELQIVQQLCYTIRATEGLSVTQINCSKAVLISRGSLTQHHPERSTTVANWHLKIILCFAIRSRKKPGRLRPRARSSPSAFQHAPKEKGSRAYHTVFGGITIIKHCLYSPLPVESLWSLRRVLRSHPGNTSEPQGIAPRLRVLLVRYRCSSTYPFLGHCMGQTSLRESGPVCFHNLDERVCGRCQLQP